MAQDLNLANKYRPNNLSEVVGQDHIVKSIRNSFKREEFPHTVMFSGVFGTGKTTMARIAAAMLNCDAVNENGPCGSCDTCKRILKGKSRDVQEMDAASCGKVDEIRALKESLNYAPIECRNKVYIIDECHRLTNAATEALLKATEEPPKYVYFFLCTTEPRKMPATLHSRFQQYDFRKIGNSTIHDKIKEISKKEKITIDDTSIWVIAKSSSGSMRNAIKNLESLRNYCDNEVTEEKAYEMLGVTDASFSFSLVDKIIKVNSTEAICIVNEMINQGYDAKNMMSEIDEHLRNLLVIKTCKEDEVIDLPEKHLERLKAQSKMIDVAVILDISKIFQKASIMIEYEVKPQYILEQSIIESIIHVHKTNSEK